MYIQYVGFDTSPSSRVYTFHVIDVPYEARDFTVQIHAKAFRPDRLSLQDGPSICYARLVQELRGRTSESPADSCMSVGERDIDDYIEQHRSKRPKAKRNKEESVTPPVVDSGNWWRKR